MPCMDDGCAFCLEQNSCLRCVVGFTLEEGTCLPSKGANSPE